MKKTLSEVAKKGLALLEKNASKKANSECVGFLYEPKVPKKLKKRLCIVMTCIMTVVATLAGGRAEYKAAQYDYAAWSTYAQNPAIIVSTSIAVLYISDEVYEWSVTSYSAPSGYGQVTLNGYNNSITILNGGRVLTQKGSRNFTVNMGQNHSETYAKFRIDLSYDSYPTSYSGYAKLPD